MALMFSMPGGVAARRTLRVVMWVTVSAWPRNADAQGQDAPQVRASGDSVHIKLVDVDIRSAVQALSAYLDRPVTFGALSGVRVTLETHRPVHPSAVPQLLRGVLESNNLELALDSVGAFYRVRSREQARPPVARAQLAQTGGRGSLQLWVLRMKHARAADVAATVNALYGRAGALGELGARPGTLTDQLQEARVPTSAAAPSPQGGGGPPAMRARQDAPLAPASFVGEVTIVPDAGSNSLLIRATQGDYDLIRAAVEQVDTRPLQVLIEVLIAEARKDRSFSFGVDMTLPPTTMAGTENTRLSGSIVGLGLGDFALKVMGVGGADIDATLRAAASRGDVTIVSRPVVLTANNEPASILVGSQRPFVQVSRSLPTESPQRDQVIQYRDVGTKLRVHPTISADGYVMLEITQEVNAATAEVQFDAPVISTRSVSSRLLIRDGQTIVLGGLTDRQKDGNQAGVPILSNIPILGGLFGRASRRVTETELFLFLTPRIIRSDEEAEDASSPLRERARKIQP